MTRRTQMRMGWVLAMGIVGVATADAPGKERRPVLAVFDLEDRGVDLPKDVTGRLGDYLATKLAESGAFQVVPRAKVKGSLRRQKKASYRQCYDQGCQLELGQELAADKMVSSQLLKLGTGCTVAATLYDLKRATAERASTVRSGCDQEAIVNAIDQVVARLADGAVSEQELALTAAEAITQFNEAVAGALLQDPDCDKGLAAARALTAENLDTLRPHARVLMAIRRSNPAVDQRLRTEHLERMKTVSAAFASFGTSCPVQTAQLQALLKPLFE